LLQQEFCLGSPISRVDSLSSPDCSGFLASFSLVVAVASNRAVGSALVVRLPFPSSHASDALEAWRDAHCIRSSSSLDSSQSQTFDITGYDSSSFRSPIGVSRIWVAPRRRNSGLGLLLCHTAPLAFGFPAQQAVMLSDPTDQGLRLLRSVARKGSYSPIMFSDDACFRLLDQFGTNIT
jgi:hypothetical protein